MNYTVLIAAKDALLMRHTPVSFDAIVDIAATGIGE